MPGGLSFDEIPGLAEAMASRRERAHAKRSEAWTRTHLDIMGFRVRVMTVHDYILLEQIRSPMIHAEVPSPKELAMFLWILSDDFVAWNEWPRSSFPGWMRSLAAWRHGSRVRKAFKNEEQFVELALACFSYVRDMFQDAPALSTTKASPQASAASYIAYWFDILAFQHHMSPEEVLRATLPQLFQRLCAIKERIAPRAPAGDAGDMDLKMFILNGLRGGDFTADDLRAGRVTFPNADN